MCSGRGFHVAHFSPSNLYLRQTGLGLSNSATETLWFPALPDSTPHTNKNKKYNTRLYFLFCARGGGRTRMTLRPQDFKSCASTSSATRAIFVDDTLFFRYNQIIMFSSGAFITSWQIKNK